MLLPITGPVRSRNIFAIIRHTYQLSTSTLDFFEHSIAVHGIANLSFFCGKAERFHYNWNVCNERRTISCEDFFSVFSFFASDRKSGKQIEIELNHDPKIAWMSYLKNILKRLLARRKTDRHVKYTSLFSHHNRRRRSLYASLSVDWLLILLIAN